MAHVEFIINNIVLTLAPFIDIWSAVSLPMPELEPVIITTFPSSLAVLVHFLLKLKVN